MKKIHHKWPAICPHISQNYWTIYVERLYDVNKNNESNISNRTGKIQSTHSQYKTTEKLFVQSRKLM